MFLLGVCVLLVLLVIIVMHDDSQPSFVLVQLNPYKGPPPMKKDFIRDRWKPLQTHPYYDDSTGKSNAIVSDMSTPLRTAYAQGAAKPPNMWLSVV